MDIVVVILASTVVAAITSGLFNLFSKKLDYKRDFYKKVIEKRLYAYELLSKLMEKLVGKSSLEGNPHNIVFFDRDEFLRFYTLLQETAQNRIWYSGRTGLILTSFLQELTMEFKERNMDIHVSNDYQIRSMGVQLYNQTQRFQNDIEKAFLVDFKELHNVKLFFRK